MADLKSWIAPNEDVRAARLEAFKQYACYFLVGLICIITVFVAPIVAGGVNAEDWDYWMPTDNFGWFCWWAMKIGTVIGNLAIFGLFKAQGKTNSLKNRNYLQAKELLNKKNGQKGFVPLSPGQYQAKTWGTKGLFTMIITAAECVVIGSLALAFDWLTFISCLVSAVTAIVFGIVQMIKDEVYWTDGYLQYAKYVTRNIETAEVDIEPQEVEKEIKE